MNELNRDQQVYDYYLRMYRIAVSDYNTARDDSDRDRAIDDMNRLYQSATAALGVDAADRIQKMSMN